MGDASHPAHPRQGHAETRTRIGNNVIIDNQVQIGHGAQIEDGVTLCAQVGLGGSTTVGRGVFMGGKASSAGHLRVGTGAMVGGNTGLIADVEPGAQLIGWLGTERRSFMRSWSLFKRLPEIWRRLRRVEEQIAAKEGE